jgi:predicted kinase
MSNYISDRKRTPDAVFHRHKSKQMNKPILYIFSGLPGSGKTTLSQLLARHANAAYVRIDTIEQALRDLCSIRVMGEGYRLAYRVASDILNAGVSVVADSCNPIELTRREWEQVAIAVGIQYVNIEIICSNKRKHRARVETRRSTVSGLKMPTWPEVENREYHDWTVERIIIDTSDSSESDCFDELLSKLQVRLPNISFQRGAPLNSSTPINTRLQKET